MRNHDHTADEFRKNLESWHRNLTNLEENRNSLASDLLTNSNDLMGEHDLDISFTKQKTETEN
jgi:hypothetical protein